MWRLCATSASLGVFSVRIILCSFKASSITQKTAIIHRQPPVTCPSRLLPNCKNVSERCQTDAPSADHCPGWCCKRVSACSFLNHKAPACPDTSLTLIQTALLLPQLLNTSCISYRLLASSPSQSIARLSSSNTICLASIMYPRYTFLFCRR